jgi:hypothetical protein
VELKALLEEGLSRAVLSKPRRESAYSQVTVRPVRVDEALRYYDEFRQVNRCLELVDDGILRERFASLATDALVRNCSTPSATRHRWWSSSISSTRRRTC